MVFGIVTTYSVAPGRNEDFMALAGEQQAQARKLGANVMYRRVIAGGTAAGNIVSAMRFATDAARAAYVDEVTKPGAAVPLVAATRAANPPATRLSLIWLNEFPETDSAVPAPAAVLASSRFRVAAGHLAAAQAALLEARRLRAELGISATIFTVPFGGEMSGEYRLNVGYASFAEMEQAEARVRAHNATHGGPPIPPTVAAGSLVPVARSVSILLAI